MTCPLCSSDESSLYDQDKFRPYFQCGKCTLIYVPRNFCLSPEEEKKRYEAHDNDESNPQYQEYLAKIKNSLIPSIQPQYRGLDFGCGKSQSLEKIFAQNKIKLDSYDYYFFKIEEIWEKKYDFIILSEVIEHLRNPLEIMEKLAQLLKVEGQFFIKTKFYPPDKDEFKNWFYKRDATHVSFFNEKSMQTLGQTLGMQGPFNLSLNDLYQFKF